MKHYVIVNDWSRDMDGGFTILGVTHTLDEAKEVFNKHVVECKQYATEEKWEVYDNNDTQFDAGEEGFYAVNHECLYIQEIITKNS